MNIKLLMPILIVGLMVTTGVALLGTDDSDAEVTSGTCGTNLTWTYDSVERSLTISGTGTTMNDFATTSDNPWFNYTINKLVWDCPNLTHIGNNAFAGQAISDGGELPSNLTSIGNNAFMGNPVTYTRLPYKITSIGENAFKNCTSLALDKLPDKLTSIGNSAFENCPQLKIMTVPYGVTSISANVFKDCTGLRTFIIPSVITSIDDTAFAGTTNLTQVGNLSNVDIMGKFPNVTGTLAITKSGTCGAPSSTSLRWVYYEDVNLLYIYGAGSAVANYHVPTSKPWEEYKTAMTDVIWSCSNLTTLNNNTFQYCSALVNPHLPDSITSIGAGVFLGCTSLNISELPPNMERIHTESFLGCTSLALTELPSKITFIGDYAFRNCTNLSLTSLPNNLTSIGKYAFYECRNLNMVSLPETITSLGDSAFGLCTNLALQSLPESLTTIPAGVFSHTSVTITELPEGIVSIGRYAFDNCSVLALSKLPENLTFIGAGAFRNCPTISITSIPDGITTIDTETFRGCTNLALSRLPSELESIGQSAFEDCINIGQIDFPTTLTSISYYAFSGCTGIYFDNLSDGLTSLNSGAFTNCNNLNRIYIPSSLTFIGSSVFAGCTQLTEISISQSFPTPASGNTGLEYLTKITIRGDDSPMTYTNVSGARLPQYTSRNTISEIILDDVNYIAPYTFYNQNALPKIKDALIYIDSDFQTLMTASQLNSGTAGYVCYVLSEGNAGINLTYGVYKTNDISLVFSGIGTTMTDWTATTLPYLTYTPTLTKVEFNTPNLVKIGNYAVYNAGNLTDVMIPNTVETIGKYAFAGCADLTTIGLGNNLNLIDDYAFQGCESLVLTELPSSLTTIHKGAFEDCSALALTTLPSSVTKLAIDSFKNCTSLAMTELPETIHLVASGVFEGCTQMSDMTIYQSTLFSGDSGLRLNTVTLKYSEDASDYTHPEYNPWTISQDTIQTVTLDGITHLQSNTFAGMNNIYEVLAVDVPNQLGWYVAPNAQSSVLANLVEGDEAWLMTYSSAEADINYDSPVVNLDNADGTIVVNGVDVPLEPDMMVYPSTYGEGGNKTVATMIKFIPIVVILSVLGALAMMVRGKRFEL